MEIDIVLRGVSSSEVPRVISALSGSTTKHLDRSLDETPLPVKRGYRGKARVVDGVDGAGCIGTVLASDLDRRRICVDFGEGPVWLPEEHLDPVYENSSEGVSDAASKN